MARDPRLRRYRFERGLRRVQKASRSGRRPLCARQRFGNGEYTGPIQTAASLNSDVQAGRAPTVCSGATASLSFCRSDTRKRCNDHPRLSERSVRDDQLTPPAGYLSPALASDQVDRALTFLEPARWRLIARVVDLSALTLGAVVALLLSGSLVTHLDFAAVYAAFVLSTTRGPQMLVQRMLPCGYDFFADAARACTVSVLLALGTGALLSFSAPESLAIELWLLTVLAMGATRVAAALLGQRARREGALMTPALVVGAGFVGARVFRRLVETPEYGLRPVGFLDADPLPGALEMDDGAPVLGGPDDLAEVVAQTGARHVILAFASERDNRLVELVKRCRKLRIDVSVVPRLYESMNERATLEHIGGLPLLSLKAVDPKGWQFALKHTFDRGAAMLALLALAPLMVVLALAVKLSTPGPGTFRQRRVGRDGLGFDVLQVRTLRQKGPSPKLNADNR